MVKTLRGCDFKGCTNTHRAKGFCSGHWQRYHKYGDPGIVGKRGNSEGYWKGKSGNSHPQWKGNKAGYMARHAWLRNNFVKPLICTRCGGSESRIEWANISGKHIRDISDYEALCVGCHRRQDFFKEFCNHGHRIIGDNLMMVKGKWRKCRTCSRDADKRQKAKKRLSLLINEEIRA